MVYDPGKEYLVRARLLPLAAAAGCADLEAYVARLAGDAVERRRALDALTINETSWFRDQTPYTAFADSMLPALLQSRAAVRHLRIWSAACSSGQEAYSVAMLLDEHLPPGWTAEILATDVSTAMLARVEAGHYSEVEVARGLTPARLAAYFTRTGTGWTVSPRLRAMVSARHLNLAAPFTGLGTFDVVLVRNVLIYFDAATKHDVLRRLHAHVATDGYLLLGASETTFDMPPDVAALWAREQLGRVQAHRPATGRRTAPASSHSSTPASSPVPSLVPTGEEAAR